MGAFLQLFKDFFLLLTTGYIIFWFLKDYRKAIIWYLFFYAVIATLGLTRVIYNENIIIPLLLLIILSFKPSSISKSNLFYVAFFLYMLLITYINKLEIIDEYSNGAYLLVVLLIFSNYIFKNADYAIKIVFFIWLITLAFTFKTVIYGEDLFSVGNINSAERNMVLDTGIKGSSIDHGIDLNYFSSSQAIGALITLMFIIYRQELISAVHIPVFSKRIIAHNLFSIALFLLMALQIWFVFRGLSRGGILVFFSGILAFAFTLRRMKYLLYSTLFLVGTYYIMNKVGIIDLLLERIIKDESGTSGRDIIMLGMIESIYSQGGFLQIIFGGGNGWPWWEFWSFNPLDKRIMPSSHNQWLSIFVNFGILGLTLFMIPLYQNIRNSIKHKNTINNIRIVLFICVFVYSMSLEPLIYAHYAWFLLALSSTYTPNLRPRIKT